MRWLLLVLGVAPLGLAANAANDAVSDGELIARASAVMAEQAAPADRILGLHKGVPVIVDVRCAGNCPASTLRIIRYAIDPGPACAKLNGDTATLMVPVSITSHPQSFCIPHVLYQRKLYTDRPYQK